MNSQLELQKEWTDILAAVRDSGKFKVLYERHHPPIFRYVYRRVNDMDIAADLTSEVFLKAMKNLENYRFRGVPFQAWLFRIAHNCVQQHFRDKSRERVILLDVKVVSGMLEPDPSIADENESILSRVKQATEKLKGKELEILTLRFYENLSFREIGEVMGSSENSAKVKLHRIIKKLRGAVK